MQAKSWIMMRILLNQFHSKSPKDYLNLLPQEDSKQILAQNVSANNIEPAFVKPYEFFKNIHFSWVAPHIQSLPKHVQELIVSALPQPLAAGLQKYLKIQTKRIPLPPRAASYFVKNLYNKIRNPEILPPEFLPKETLCILLDLNRQELVNLIDYLGLYDLAEELRHMVDKTSLRTVYACLDNMQMQFVRTCLHQKSKFVPFKLNLQNWDGNAEKLKQTLHQRGLYRLGKALSGMSRDFYWHLSRNLDTGRSATLDKFYSEQASPGVSSALTQQVTNVLNFLKQKSET